MRGRLGRQAGREGGWGREEESVLMSRQEWREGGREGEG